jgi:hypothetical protein
MVPASYFSIKLNQTLRFLMEITDATIEVILHCL